VAPHCKGTSRLRSSSPGGGGEGKRNARLRSLLPLCVSLEQEKGKRRARSLLTRAWSAQGGGREKKKKTRRAGVSLSLCGGGNYPRTHQKRLADGEGGRRKGPPDAPSALTLWRKEGKKKTSLLLVHDFQGGGGRPLLKGGETSAPTF